MTQKMYEVQPPKKKKNTIKVEVDILGLPSPVHKYGALNNKSVKFEDKRKKKPKHKNKNIDW
jgi:hypothetical protein